MYRWCDIWYGRQKSWPVSEYGCGCGEASEDLGEWWDGLGAKTMYSTGTDKFKAPATRVSVPRFTGQVTIYYIHVHLHEL